MDGIPTWAQSSIDPTQISSFLQNIGRALAGTVTFLLVLKGVDPLVAGQSWGQFVQLVATGAPAAYATWHTGEAIFGLIRKLFVRTAVSPRVSIQP